MVYFISDVHLGASYIPDRKAHEARVVEFLESIAKDATELYLLGDILDYWYEYRTVVPRGYVRFFGALARLADRGVRITWLTGNHDIWLYDYLSEELGIEVVDAPYICRCIDGKNFVMAHGDRIGHQKRSFRFICKLFRNPVCQKLYASVHPRWTIPFAHSWSKSSRANGEMEVGGARHADMIVSQAGSLLSLEFRPDFVVLGHHHVALERNLDDTTKLVVLGDWIDKDTYGRFDGKDLKLETFGSH